MGQFDQTARPLGKMDGARLLRLALSCCTPRPRLTLVGWEDARRLVCPGEPDRTNDLVATFRDEEYLRESDSPEGEDGLQIEQVSWDIERGCFLCRMLDDIDASVSFGDDAQGLKYRYVSRGWRVWNRGCIARLFLHEEPA